MSQADTKRQGLFDKFSRQLLLLKQHNLIKHEFQFEKPYLCPICLREFGEEHLSTKKSNHLTLEDAPPAALGGTKIALTCKQCNNTCGHTIDNHLVEVIRAIDSSYFYKGSKHDSKIMFEGKPISVELTSQGDGVLTAYHRTSRNNPTLLDKFIYALKNKEIGPLLNLEAPKQKHDPHRVNYALVKANYIITFARFGYIFLLDPLYNKIREQLLNPDQVIYPYTPFIKDQFDKSNIGTMYITTTAIESILNVFALNTDYSETIIAGTLNLPPVEIDDYSSRIDNMKVNNVLKIYTTKYDPNADLFNDIDEINKILRWINGIH